MPHVHPLRVEPLTEDAFAPYGELLAERSRDPDLSIAGLRGWTAAFEADASTQLLFFTTDYKEPRFVAMERHLHVAQAVIPVRGAQLVAVAAPTGPGDTDALPSPGDVRAFLAGEGQGYVMKPGTWHAVGRFPLSPPAADFVMITDVATSAELVERPPAEWRRTQLVDFEQRFDTVFEFVAGAGSPDDRLPPARYV